MKSTKFKLINRAISNVLIRNYSEAIKVHLLNKGCNDSSINCSLKASLASVILALTKLSHESSLCYFVEWDLSDDEKVNEQRDVNLYELSLLSLDDAFESLFDGLDKEELTVESDSAIDFQKLDISSFAAGMLLAWFITNCNIMISKTYKPRGKYLRSATFKGKLYSFDKFNCYISFVTDVKLNFSYYVKSDNSKGPSVSQVISELEQIDEPCLTVFPVGFNRCDSTSVDDKTEGRSSDLKTREAKVASRVRGILDSIPDELRSGARTKNGRFNSIGDDDISK